MTAPVVWIVVPFIAAGILLVLPRERWISYLGMGLALFLAAVAFWLPPDTAQRFGPFSLRIDATLSVLGRSVSLTAADQTLLILVYAMAAFWFFGYACHCGRPPNCFAGVGGDFAVGGIPGSAALPVCRPSD